MSNVDKIKKQIEMLENQNRYSGNVFNLSSTELDEMKQRYSEIEKLKLQIKKLKEN